MVLILIIIISYLSHNINYIIIIISQFDLTLASAFYTNKAKSNLFACLSRMAGHALYGMAPCFGHTGVTFDAENDRPGPGPGSLQGHFEAARGQVFLD